MERIKGLFSTPKKAMITCVVIALAVASLSVGAVFAAVYFDRNEDRLENQIENTIAPANTEAQQDQTQQGQTEPNQAQQDQAAKGQAEQNAANQNSSAAAAEAKQANDQAHKISQKKAESIALKNAGFSHGQVSNLHSHLDYDDGYHEYDVQFFKGDMEYEYSIDVSSGNIMEKDIESVYD